ncbi:lipase 3-like, partial [Anopheles cruzii]|uniref:lipase 3-like n=1 Tax=Anopheles cruzii TaxID=68878 RepID=UPI0022EC91A2
MMVRSFSSVVILEVLLALFGCVAGGYSGRKEITFNWVRSSSDESRNNTAVLLQRDGYGPIRVRVRTDDGYLLTVYRMQPKKSRAGVVLLHHGIRQSSDMWMYLGPKRSLPYKLYDAGYDVWMSNSRASPEIDGHERLDRDSDHYWDFSFHEIGTSDLPAIIDHIRRETNRKTIHFVGYSEAATAALVMLSERPEYNAWLASVELLAPPAFMSYGQYAWISRMVQPIRALFPWSVYYARDALPTRICTLFRAECCLMFGHLDDRSEGGCFVLDNVSLKQIEHYRQIIATGKFQQFDYGYTGNLNRYKRDPPPDYCLWNVTAPVTLHYGNQDQTVDWRGVEQLARNLPNVATLLKQLYKGFTHRDFYQNPKARTTVYENIVKSIKRHSVA